MQEREWVNSISDNICKKMKKVAERNVGKIPYLTENGLYQDMTEKDIFWWTNGFW